MSHLEHLAGRDILRDGDGVLLRALHRVLHHRELEFPLPFLRRRHRAVAHDLWVYGPDDPW